MNDHRDVNLNTAYKTVWHSSKVCNMKLTIAYFGCNARWPRPLVKN